MFLSVNISEVPLNLDATLLCIMNINNQCHIALILPAKTVYDMATLQI